MEIIDRKEAKRLGLKRYFTGKPCKHGHIVERQVTNGGCIVCINNSSRTRKQKPKVKEKYKKQRHKYNDNNRLMLLEKRRKYHKENQEKIRESRRDYYKKYMRKKRKDPLFKAKTRMRDMLRRLLTKTKRNKNSRTETTLGYTAEQLKNHIESLFTTGMSWDNLGEWHVDHIRSIKSFLDDGVTDPKIINALSNLQPLWATDNLRKGVYYFSKRPLSDPLDELHLYGTI